MDKEDEDVCLSHSRAIDRYC